MAYCGLWQMVQSGSAEAWPNIENTRDPCLVVRGSVFLADYSFASGGWVPGSWGRAGKLVTLLELPGTATIPEEASSYVHWTPKTGKPLYAVRFVIRPRTRTDRRTPQTPHRNNIPWQDLRLLLNVTARSLALVTFGCNPHTQVDGWLLFCVAGKFEFPKSQAPAPEGAH